MKQNQKQALLWIAKILNSVGVSYRIGGGMAVHLYGGERGVNDIDISLEGNHFEKIIPLVKDYIIAGPKHYKNEKWDCDTLSLQYIEQDIDITDSSTLRMKSKNGEYWIANEKIYKKFPERIIEIDGVSVPVMDPRVLIEYKKELSGKHQEDDIDFLTHYINERK